MQLLEAADYCVTLDTERFRTAFRQTFSPREILTLMTVVVGYNEARTKALEENAPHATINFESLCADAAHENVSPKQIQLLLTLLSV